MGLMAVYCLVTILCVQRIGPHLCLMEELLRWWIDIHGAAKQCILHSSVAHMHYGGIMHTDHVSELF